MKAAVKTLRMKKISNRKRNQDPEKRIEALIKSSAIASAGRNAIAASFKKGLSVTVLQDNIIYRLHPDGTKTAIKKLVPRAEIFATGKMFIK